MHKTLFLVFIHGFKGGDDTFGTFPEHLRALLSHALPNVSIVTIAYPQYETRGDLKECVARFREWLENKVIDLEVANGTPSPTVDPAVHTILVGHSMGGIVAAEALLLLASEQPIPASASKAAQSSTGDHSDPQLVPDIGPLNFMFPHVQGMLAFDTPFLGLAPEMIAHGLEGGHRVVTGAYNTYNEVASMFGWGGSASESAATAATASKAPIAALPAPPASSMTDAAAAPKWSSWGKYAMFAGAVGAVAAGGAAAYSQREKLSAGWSWAGSHLLFVGDLAKAERLKQRVDSVNTLCSERGIGAANIYTNLGRGAREGYGLTETLAGRDRTFCNLPPAVKEGRDQKTQNRPSLSWFKAINEKAKDETTAHVSMFFPKENPGFYALGEASKEMIASWIDYGWYNTSSGKADEDELNEKMNPSSIGKDWEGLDTTALHEDDDLHMREEESEGANDHDTAMLERSILVDTNPGQNTTLDSQSGEEKVAVPTAVGHEA